MESNSLKNIDIYKKQLSNSSVEIYSKYFGVIQEYMTQCIDKINTHNQKYYKYVIYKGIDTISHIFKILLLYTKNLDVVYYHCQKSFYYYVEFMRQIGGNNHIFLQLSSKDASLFIYKKTIFEINNEEKKKLHISKKEKTIITNVELLMDIYIELLKHIIRDFDFNILDKYVLLKKVELTLSKSCQNILNLSLCYTEEEYSTLLKIILIFYKINSLKICENKKKTDNNIFLYIEIFTLKLKTIRIDFDSIQSKLLLLDNNNLNTLTATKYINWLTQT